MVTISIILTSIQLSIIVQYLVQIPLGNMLKAQVNLKLLFLCSYNNHHLYTHIYHCLFLYKNSLICELTEQSTIFVFIHATTPFQNTCISTWDNWNSLLTSFPLFHPYFHHPQQELLLYYVTLHLNPIITSWFT